MTILASILGASVHPLLGEGMNLCAFFCVFSFVASLLTGNASIVDRLWSITPVLYVWQAVLLAAFGASYTLLLTSFTTHPVQAALYFVRFLLHNPLLFAMLVLPTMWGLRLTYNFYRKGGYNWHDEDYRWDVLRKWINNWFVFQLFNITFIATYQNILLFLIACPVFIPAAQAFDAVAPTAAPLSSATSLEALTQRLVSAPASPFTWAMVACSALFLGLLLLETLVDRSQFDFYKRRSLYRSKSSSSSSSSSAIADPTGDLRRGFQSTGFFAWSRHLNFFSEISLWWAYLLLGLTLIARPIIANGMLHLYNIFKGGSSNSGASLLQGYLPAPLAQYLGGVPIVDVVQTLVATYVLDTPTSAAAAAAASASTTSSASLASAATSVAGSFLFKQLVRPLHVHEICALLGAPLLTLLFQGSTTFTEYITTTKYPAYKQYQKAVSRLVPSIFSKKPQFIEDNNKDKNDSNNNNNRINDEDDSSISSGVRRRQPARRAKKE